MSQVFSDVNKQPSLEWRCVNWKREIMAESGRWVSNIKVSILLKKGWFSNVSIFEMRRITHLHGSAHIGIALRVLIVCVLFFDLEETLKYLNIQKVWRKTQVYFNNVVKDILPVNFTKFLPLECCQMKTAFKTKRQCFFGSAGLVLELSANWFLKDYSMTFQSVQVIHILNIEHCSTI